MAGLMRAVVDAPSKRIAQVCGSARPATYRMLLLQREIRLAPADQLACAIVPVFGGPGAASTGSATQRRVLTCRQSSVDTRSRDWEAVGIPVMVLDQSDSQALPGGFWVTTRRRNGHSDRAVALPTSCFLAAFGFFSWRFDLSNASCLRLKVNFCGMDEAGDWIKGPYVPNTPPAP